MDEMKQIRIVPTCEHSDLSTVLLGLGDLGQGQGCELFQHVLLVALLVSFESSIVLIPRNLLNFFPMSEINDEQPSVQHREAKV